MVRKRVRVVVADQSAITDLLGMIFPIVQVARSARGDYTINTQRRADDHRQPKDGHWLEKGSRRREFSYCGRFVGLAFHNTVWIVDVGVASARTLFNGCYWADQLTRKIFAGGNVSGP